MSNSTPPRLLVEGIERLVAHRVHELVESITADIVADKIKELKPQLQAELNSVISSNPAMGLETLDVMLKITTERGGKK
jgi:hypothetical protein